MSLLLTQMQNLRANGNLDKWEIRGRKYEALNMFIQQTASPTGIITPELREKAGVAVGRTFESAVIDDNPNITIGNARSLVIVDAENTSRMIVIPFATLSHGFTQVPTLFQNNEIGRQRDFETKMKLTTRLFSEALDDLAISTLEANKSKVFNDTLLYTELADTIVATFAQREDILGDTNVIMDANDFFGELHVVANSGFNSLVKDLAESNQFNSVDKRMEYNDKTWFFDRKVVNGVGKYATAYVVQEDSVGVMWRHDREALAGTVMQDGTTWGIDMLPGTQIPVDTYFYESKGDFSGIAGAASADMTVSMKNHYGFAIDVAFQAAYISDTANRPAPIMKIQINRSETDTDVTAPTKTGVSGAVAFTNITLEFSEPVCTDQAGTIISGDVSGLFTPSLGGGSTITSAIASADGLSIDFIFNDTGIVNTDIVTIAANKLFDGAGNAFAASTVLTASGGVWT